MNLEPVIQSELNQKEKNKYCILTHIYMESREIPRRLSGKESACSAGNARDLGSILPDLGQEDLLKKEMVTHSSILAWKIPWTEKPVRLQAMGLQRVGHD